MVLQYKSWCGILKISENMFCFNHQQIFKVVCAVDAGVTSYKQSEGIIFFLNLQFKMTCYYNNDIEVHID